MGARRKVWRTVPLLAATALLLAAAWFCSRAWDTPAVRIRAGAWLVAPGMTERQVEDCLRCPAEGYYPYFPPAPGATVCLDLLRKIDLSGGRRYRYWNVEDGSLEVTFDSSGLVVEAEFQEYTNASLPRLRRRLERLLSWW